MGKVQTRKAISVKGTTYAQVKARAALASISISDFVEQAVAAELKRCAYFEASFRCGAMAGETGMCGRHVGMVPSVMPVARAVAEVLREGDREVERAATAVEKALPRESKIVAGPPPEQTAMLGREETPRGQRSAAPTCPCCSRPSMKRGVRCGTCAISCKPVGDGWKRGRMCPAGNRVVEPEPIEDEALDDDAEAVEEVRAPLRRSMPPVDPIRGVRPPPPGGTPAAREPTLDDLDEIAAEEAPAPRRNSFNARRFNERAQARPLVIREGAAPGSLSLKDQRGAAVPVVPTPKPSTKADPLAGIRTGARGGAPLL